MQTLTAWIQQLFALLPEYSIVVAWLPIAVAGTWSWHGVTAAAWSLVFIHWIFCDHDTASVHIVTDNQRHSHRKDVSTFPPHFGRTHSTILLVGGMVWNTEYLFPCFLCLCDVADFFFKGFQYISTRWDGFIYFSLCSVTSLNVIGLFPGADQSDGMLVFVYCLHGHSRYVTDVCWCWKMTSWEGLQILRVY